MGRTNPTYRDFLERYESQFSDYRRGLRRTARHDFDRLFERARAYADAAGYANHLDRDRLVLLSMVLGHEAALRECDAEIERLRDDVELLRTDMEQLHTDVAQLRTDVEQLRTDVETLQCQLDDADGG